MLLNLMAKSSGGGGSLIANPRVAIMGDSLVMYHTSPITFAGAQTFVRDAAGMVTCAHTGHGVCGNEMGVVQNFPDSSFDGRWQLQYVDANNYRFQTTVLSAASTTPGGLSSIDRDQRPSLKGCWPHLRGLYRGGLKLAGFWGASGDQVGEMNASADNIVLTGADVVIIVGGANDLSNSTPPATTKTNMQAHVTKFRGAGMRVIICSVTPRTNAAGNNPTLYANALAINTAYQEICATDPNNVKYVDLWTPCFSTVTNDGQPWSWVGTDGLHWGTRTGILFGTLVKAKMDELATGSDLMPTSSSNFPTGNGWTAIAQYGSWTGTGGGGLISATGTVTANNTLVGNSCSPVASLIDRGAGIGWWQQMTVSATAGGQGLTYYPGTNAGVLLTTLGLVVGDVIQIAYEIDISNIQNGKLRAINAQIDLGNNSRGYTITTGSNATSFWDDTYQGIVFTEGMTIGTGTTRIFPNINIVLDSASVSDINVKIGRIVVYKKTS